MTKQFMLRKMLFDLAQEPVYTRALFKTCSADALVNINVFVKILCRWVKSGKHPTCIQGGVFLATLYPSMSGRQRAEVCRELLPLLHPETESEQLVAVSYALQYNRSRPVLAAFRRLCDSPSVNDETREHARFAVGDLDRMKRKAGRVRSSGNLKPIMTRNGVTQTRTWTYDPATLRLASVTLPETGATSFTYNSQGLVASKTDAKLQRVDYLRDSFNRVTEIRRFHASGVEQGAQRTTFTYDLGTNGAGRLGRVSYGLPGGPNPVLEEFQYTASGLVTMKMLEWGPSEGRRMRVRYTYNNEGVRTSIQYPSHWVVDHQAATGVEAPGPIYTTAFDTLGRPIGLSDNSGNTLVSSAQFNPRRPAHQR